jgi:Na+-translocating ferredoxin:NAD+ oxidoreductase RnfD subunit
LEKRENLNLETRVAVIESEIDQFSIIFDKFDGTIDKLTNVTNALEKMLSLQSLKLDNNDRDNLEISSKIKDLDDRLKVIEKWRWLTIGLAMGLLAAIAKVAIPWSILFSI